MTVVEVTDRLLGYSHEKGLALNEVKIRTGKTTATVQNVSVENENGKIVIVFH